MEEKEKSWRESNEVLESFPKEEREVIWADFNGHVDVEVTKRRWQGLVSRKGTWKERW